MKKRLSILLLLLALFIFPTGCEAYTRYSKSFFGTFDTVVTIIGYAKDQRTFDQITDEAMTRFQRLHQVFDAYNTYEGVQNLCIMNRDAAKAPVQVEPEMIALLLFCKEMQPLTLGRVNIALGAVLSLWHDYRAEAELNPLEAAIPPMELLQEAAKHVDFDSLVINEEEGTVFYTDPKLLIDLGAVAKGYAAEQVAQWMLSSEMPSFIISAGGNVRAGEQPEDGRMRWGISIQNPDEIAFGGPSEKDLDNIYVKNASIVTSGDYIRYYTVDGVRYHHIISPDTLMPADYMRAITVVCEDSGWADMLSTMLFLMPYEEGLQFVESMDGVEAYWVLEDNVIKVSSGMHKYLKSMGVSSSDPM